MRAKSVVLVILVALMINLPFLHSRFQRSQVERNGVDVVAQVTDTRADEDGNLVAFTIPADGDREEVEGIATVDDQTFAAVQDTGEIEVRILPDNPDVYLAEGQTTSRFGLVVTILADLFLLLMVLFVLKFSKRLRPVLVLVATEDLERCPPGSVLDRVEGDRYVVCGEVSAIEDDEVLLDLGDRRVRVLLDGHRNPAGYEQPVKATGRMVG